MTWTYNKYGVIAVVTAEDTEQACCQLAKAGVPGVTSSELIPCVTSTRWVRVLRNQHIHTPGV